MTLDLPSLESKALAATPGPWVARACPEIRGRDVMSTVSVVDAQPIADCYSHAATTEAQQEADAVFIAAANPQTVLALIERVRVLEEGLRDALPVLEAASAMANNEFLGEGGKVVDLKQQLFGAWHDYVFDEHQVESNRLGELRALLAKEKT